MQKAVPMLKDCSMMGGGSCSLSSRSSLARMTNCHPVGQDDQQGIAFFTSHFV